MLRRGHPAWLIVASPKGPLLLATLRRLVDANPGGIDEADALERLTEILTRYADDAEFEIDADPIRTARRELRDCIRRKLIVERDGRLFATDALHRAIDFIDSLDDQTMTSTASRLATVQRAIENLTADLSSDQETRANLLRARIDRLKADLAKVEKGRFEVLSGSRAEEEIREVYQLAISLRADFRRVEDSFRQEDRRLRETILRHQKNRGEVVDDLLGSHQRLLQTVEGQVFDGFYQQLHQRAELELMKSRLRSILSAPPVEAALTPKQRADLRGLTTHLLDESERVIQARAQTERDVRGFLQSGFADEHLRIGSLVQEITRVALSIDWASVAVRRDASPLPPVAIAANHLPLVGRLLVKQVDSVDDGPLDLEPPPMDPDGLGEEFWQAYNALDRQRLFEDTLAALQRHDGGLTIGELAARLPPDHDLETIAFWLTMARQAGADPDEAIESFVLDGEDLCTRFDVPRVSLSHAGAIELNPELLE